jgi:hypothetical protein
MMRIAGAPGVFGDVVDDETVVVAPFQFGQAPARHRHCRSACQSSNAPFLDEEKTSSRPFAERVTSRSAAGLLTSPRLVGDENGLSRPGRDELQMSEPPSPAARSDTKRASRPSRDSVSLPSESVEAKSACTLGVPKPSARERRVATQMSKPPPRFGTKKQRELVWSEPGLMLDGIGIDTDQGSRLGKAAAIVALGEPQVSGAGTVGIEVKPRVVPTEEGRALAGSRIDHRDLLGHRKSRATCSAAGRGINPLDVLAYDREEKGATAR